ncbi:stalk domain-containing protein [Cohnella abietis]|uniref:Copper amine oxidase-like N-terminal domain-containing protein n=1 Tax=Cohnella abietis TaxID=2507935 RepID=A0A3T1DBN4_9BACL|nr:stalk domain-containing protein [Cohnella abietis]BBI35541.1 hypothetical protein KCTCHS21_49400 [Cohnella abietis]
MKKTLKGLLLVLVFGLLNHLGYATVSASESSNAAAFSDNRIQVYVNNDRSLTFKGITNSSESAVTIYISNSYAMQETGNPFTGDETYEPAIGADRTFTVTTKPLSYKFQATITFGTWENDFHHDPIIVNINPTEITDYAYKKYQIEALNYVNEIRAKIGVKPVKLNAYVTKAAENHAKYISINKTLWDGLEVHFERAGKVGYTGATPTDRIIAAGGFQSAGEIVTGASTAKAAIDSWLDTAYHREPLVDPNATEFGFGIEQGAAVLNMVTGTGNKDISVFPYDGMNNVALSFFGESEIPNPIKKYDLVHSGYIITFNHPADLTDSIKATIKNSNGDKIPFFQEYAGTLFLYPARELSYDETYTVSVDYEINGNKQNKTWSFKTIKHSFSKAEQEAYDKGVKVSINGKNIYNFDQSPVIVDKNVYIPLRGVFEMLNAKVTWDPKTRTVIVNKQQTEIKLTIGDTKAFVNGKMVKLGAAPFVKMNSTFVPIRFVSEAIGAEVKWDGATQTVHIKADLGEPESLTDYVHNKMVKHMAPIKEIGLKYGYILDEDYIDSGWYSFKQGDDETALFYDVGSNDPFIHRLSIIRIFPETEDKILDVMKEIMEKQTNTKLVGLKELLKKVVNEKEDVDATVQINGVKMRYSMSHNPQSGQFEFNIFY